MTKELFVTPSPIIKRDFADKVHISGAIEPKKVRFSESPVTSSIVIDSSLNKFDTWDQDIQSLICKKTALQYENSVTSDDCDVVLKSFDFELSPSLMIQTTAEKMIEETTKEDPIDMFLFVGLDDSILDIEVPESESEWLEELGSSDPKPELKWDAQSDNSSPITMATLTCDLSDKFIVLNTGEDWLNDNVPESVGSTSIITEVEGANFSEECSEFNIHVFHQDANASNACLEEEEVQRYVEATFDGSWSPYPTNTAFPHMTKETLLAPKQSTNTLKRRRSNTISRFPSKRSHCLLHV